MQEGDLIALIDESLNRCRSSGSRADTSASRPSTVRSAQRAERRAVRPAARAPRRRSPDLRAVVITGRGLGVLRRRRSRDRSDRPDRVRAPATTRSDPRSRRVLDAIVAYPAPVIAAVNGPAIGAGMQLAVACDLRVVGAERDASAIPGGKLGVHPQRPRTSGGSPTLVGQGDGARLPARRPHVDVEEALRLGLVQRRADDAVAAALALADEIAGARRRSRCRGTSAR